MTDYDKTIAWWKSRNIKTEAELAEVMNGHGILLAYHSGKIENDKITYNDTREIFDHDGVTSYTGDLRTLFEIRNLKDAYELLLVSFGQHRELDEKLIKEFQARLTQNTYDTRRWQLGERPGEYKHHDYITERNEIGVSAEYTPEEMAELVDEFHVIPEEEALTAAAYFHAKFENIHPFADGNGRTGRMIMNYLLLYLGHPPVIIHEEDRKEYYKGLEAWDEDIDLDVLIEFLKGQTVKTWKKQVDRNSI